MHEIDEAFVDAAAPNANAIKNGRALVLKRKFVALHKSEDETLYFGECAGSGKSNYHCSADFVAPQNPVYRCSCPSRQFPCKHALGLLYALAQGESFSVAAVPADITEKRGKIETRAAQKKADPGKPKKVNKPALKKKIDAQLKGLDLLETLTCDLVRAGLGAMNAKTASHIEDQAKQLGNAFLPGAQAALHEFTGLFSAAAAPGQSDPGAGAREGIYTEGLDRLTRIHALVKQGRAYLRNRLDDPELKPETESGIAAWLGHAWQLGELREAGLMETDTELVQLAFHHENNLARREFVDTGIWLNLSSGAVQLTKNFRPWRAKAHIKEDDSVFHVVQVKELFVYPGDRNPRIRWEEVLPRPVEPADCARIREHAAAELAPLLKEIKNQLKSPLAGKNPFALARFARIAVRAANGKGDPVVVLEDESGARLILEDLSPGDRNNPEPATLPLLTMLPPGALAGQAALVRFQHDLDRNRLTAKLLSIVTEGAIIRLTF